MSRELCRTLTPLIPLLSLLAGPVLADDLRSAGTDNPSSPDHAPRVASKADRLPRKVVVGTAIFGPYGEYPGLDARMRELGKLFDAMAVQAAKTYSGRGLDLAILPETTVTSTRGTPSERARPLAG